MKIASFRIQNVRNLRLAECSKVPDFMVICGPNGCGKSALLEALLIAKERASAYGNLRFDQNVVCTDEMKAQISLTLAFSERDRSFAKEQFDVDCPETAEIIIEVEKTGNARVLATPRPAKLLLSYCSDAPSFPGFFDHLLLHPQGARTTTASSEIDLHTPETKTVTPRGERRFDPISQYLVGLRAQGSLQEITNLLSGLLAPLKLGSSDPSKPSGHLLVSALRGDIAIDDLSSGERDVLQTVIRLYQLSPKGGIMLLDDADLCVAPPLHAAYLRVLRALGQGSQILLTTRSPAMIAAAGSTALYELLRDPPNNGGNQLVPISSSQQMRNATSRLAWSTTYEEDS